MTSPINSIHNRVAAFECLAENSKMKSTKILFLLGYYCLIRYKDSGDILCSLLLSSSSVSLLDLLEVDTLISLTGPSSSSPILFSLICYADLIYLFKVNKLCLVLFLIIFLDHDFSISVSAAN